jgi:hypothetical protein
MVGRLNCLNAEFARHREMTNQMRRDLDMGAMREAELKVKVGEIEKVERLYHIMEARARDLEIQKVFSRIVWTREERKGPPPFLPPCDYCFSSNTREVPSDEGQILIRSPL